MKELERDGNILLNEEHREALQNEINKSREEMISGFSPEDQLKYRVVEKAMSDLGAAGINCYLFAEMPAPEGTKNNIMQYNTGGLFLEFEGGKVTKECQIKTSKYHHKIALTVAGTIFEKSKDWIKNCIETATMPTLIFDAVRWIYHDIEPEEIKKIREE